MRVPIKRIIVYWGLYSGPHILGNYQMGLHLSDARGFVGGYTHGWHRAAERSKNKSETLRVHQDRLIGDLGYSQNCGPLWVMDYTTAPNI